jgi:hypothetical protein
MYLYHIIFGGKMQEFLAFSLPSSGNFCKGLVKILLL